MSPASLGRRLAALAIAFVATGLSAQPPTLKERLDEGFRLVEAKQLDAAEVLFEEVREAARAASELAAEAEAHRGKARVRAERRDFQGAKEELDEALRLFQRARDLLGIGAVHNARGIVAWSEGDWPRVREEYEAAIQAYSEAGNPREQANAMRNLSFSAGLSWEEREGLLARALEALRAAPDPELRGKILHHWGDMLFTAGKYAACLEKLEAALPLIEKAKDKAALPRLLTSQGRVYRVHGQVERAIAQYRRALELQQQAGDLAGACQSENAIGAALSRAGRKAEARPYFERALALAEKAAVPRLVALQRLNLGVSYAETGEPAKALPLLERGERLHEVDDVTRVTYLAHAQRLLGRKQHALATAQEAVLLARRHQAPEGLLFALVERAFAHAELDQTDAALADHQEALSVLERMRRELVPADRLKQGFTDVYRQFFVDAVALHARLGRDAEALEIGERGRARAYLDLLATKELLEARGERLPSVLASNVTVEPPGVAEIASTLARLRTTLLSYWVTDDATFVWALAPDGRVRSRRLAVSSRRLAALVRTLEPRPPGLSRGAADEVVEQADASDRTLPLTTRGGDAVVLGGGSEKAARELYDLLVKPVADSLPKTAGARLTVVPHGPLFGLSFAALQSAPGRYLVEDYSLHYAVSAASLVQARARAVRTSPGTGALIVADPALPPALADTEKLLPLPGARAEAAAVATRLPAKPQPVVLEGAAASESEVRKRAPSQSVLHFATHGVVSDEQPFDSFLALAAGGGEDGRLTSSEIYGLRLRSELVVLSACRSGRGRISGDGVSGLSRAFAYAGAPSLLATLWDLSDATAARLLPDFYAAWRRTGDRAGALRESQLALLAKLRAGEISVDTPAGRFKLPEHPALWAPFVLIGEP